MDRFVKVYEGSIANGQSILNVLSSLGSSILIRVGKVFKLVRLEEALESDWGDLRILFVVQILFQVGLTVDTVVLIEPFGVVSGREKKKMGLYTRAILTWRGKQRCWMDLR